MFVSFLIGILINLALDIKSPDCEIFWKFVSESRIAWGLP